MRKLIIVVIVLAIIWAVPGLRNRIGLAALPLLERLGPVGDRMAVPVHNFSAKNEATFYLRMMRDDQTEGRTLPDERTFTRWVTQRMPQESGFDPWGNAYWMKRNGRTFTVGSNGADGKRDTADDVTHTVTF